MNVKHVSFNPSYWASGYGQPTALQKACENQEALGFKLVRVVPVHQYESIAVFERD